MHPDEVRSLLRTYRENKSRIDYIALYAEQIKDGLRIENRPEMNAVHAQQYERSSGSFDSSPTERLALAEESAAGRRWREELEQLKRDEKQAQFDIAFVDTWLQALTDKERAEHYRKEAEKFKKDTAAQKKILEEKTVNQNIAIVFEKRRA